MKKKRKYGKQREYRQKQFLSILLGFSLGMGSCLTGFGISVESLPNKAEAAEQTLSNPRWNTDNTVSTWDCVWFGNYWQEDTNGDGKADQNDEKQPIKWRVLSVDGDDLFLLADKNLECRQYHTEMDGANWEQCTLRSWLNGYDAKSNKANQDFTSENFISSAFSSKEKEAIKQTNLMTDTGGVELEYLMNLKGKMIETSDKVFLLALDEVSELRYGFESEFHGRASETRKAKNTAFVRNQAGQIVSQMNDIEYGFWRLRSQDMYGVEEVYKLTSCVNDVGSGFFTPVTEIIPLVRPALHISLSSTTWSYAGTVTSQGKIDEISKVDDEKGGDDTEQGTFTPAGNGQSEVKETTAPTGNDSSSDSGNDSSEKDSSSDGDDSSKENDDGKKTGETVKCTKLTTQKNTYTIRKNGEGVQIKFNLTTTPKNSLTKEKVTAKVKKAIVAKVTDKKLSRNSLVVTLEGVRNGTTTLNVSVGKATAKVKIKVQITGGTCGKHLTWKRKGTVLTIKGKGDMNNFTGEIVDGNVSYSNEGYWGKKDITKVIISSGVTSIGENAFVSMKKIKSISLPKTIKSIGRSAFFGCTALRSIKFGNNLKTIGSGAFCLCKSLKSITIPKSVQKIASVAFYECDKLNAIKILSKKCKIGEDALGIKPDENVLKGDGQVLVSGVKIYGLKGSTAEKYAKKYKIPFVKVKGF